MRMTAFNRGPQRRPLPQDVLLPDELIERARPHPHRQRRIGGWLLVDGFGVVEEAVGHRGECDRAGRRRNSLFVQRQDRTGHIETMAQGQIEKGALSHELAQIQFSRLYHEHGRTILAYALRRVEDREDAADVVAETFLIAWRRLAEVPAGAEARLWLYAVARRVIANLHRSERRRTRLGGRLAESLQTELATQPAPGGEAAEALRAMGGLSGEDRELLLLVSWEGLSPSEAAKVMGVSPLAARSRLHRARRRLRALIDDSNTAAQRSPELDTEEAR